VPVGPRDIACANDLHIGVVRDGALSDYRVLALHLVSGSSAPTSVSLASEAADPSAPLATSLMPSVAAVSAPTSRLPTTSSVQDRAVLELVEDHLAMHPDYSHACRRVLRQEPNFCLPQVLCDETAVMKRLAMMGYDGL
jgi:hypothetical protein